MSGIDPQQFKEAQRKSWDSVAHGWQEWWKTFENAAQMVSDRLGGVDSNSLAFLMTYLLLFVNWVVVLVVAVIF